MWSVHFSYHFIPVISCRDSRENYSPYIEDAEYAADVDEYAEDDYDEVTQWNAEREPDRPPLQGKIRTGTLV